jgi:hypothetical protein
MNAEDPEHRRQQEMHKERDAMEQRIGFGVTRIGMGLELRKIEIGLRMALLARGHDMAI